MFNWSGTLPGPGGLPFDLDLARHQVGNARIAQARLGIQELGIVQVSCHLVQVRLGGGQVDLGGCHFRLGRRDLLVLGEIPLGLVEIIGGLAQPVLQACGCAWVRAAVMAMSYWA